MNLQEYTFEKGLERKQNCLFCSPPIKYKGLIYGTIVFYYKLVFQGLAKELITCILLLSSMGRLNVHLYITYI